MNGKLTTILYQQKNSETTTITIIPISISDVIAAIDVTNESSEFCETLEDLYEDYNRYLDLHISRIASFDVWSELTNNSSPDDYNQHVDVAMKTAFSFVDWCEHTNGQPLDVQIQTFHPSRIAGLY